MKKQLLVVTVFLMGAVNFASADMIRGIEMDFVTIGNAGNQADTQVMQTDGTTGYGSVGYIYRIGKYEVTNAQWNAFTVAAGSPTGNPSDAYDQSASYAGAQQPTNYVSWYEGLQFCNYLTSGDKSKGAYLFSGDNTNPGDFLGIDRNMAILTYGIAYVVPTENEWYKAAYYKPDGSGYSLYANGTNIAPIPGVDTNYESTIGYPWNVGTGTEEQNGTFDMMGNVKEWNETQMFGPNRGYRGSSFDGHDFNVASSNRAFDNPWHERDIGFRVASVPEPTVIPLPGAALLGTIGLLFSGWRLRRRTT